jgi:dTDP-4-amino-4,6-dideoxygalactose transaminase
MILMITGVVVAMLMISSLLAVVHLGVKSVFARAIPHRSDIAVRLLHGILAEDFRACKKAVVPVICLGKPCAKSAGLGRALSFLFTETN